MAQEKKTNVQHIPLTVDELIEVLQGFKKSGMGDTYVLHSFNPIYGVDLIMFEDKNFVRLKGEGE